MTCSTSCNARPRGRKEAAASSAASSCVACSAHHRMQRIAQCTIEQVSTLFTVYLHVPNGWPMALRRLIIAFMALVTRRWPNLRISIPLIFTPYYTLPIASH